MQISNFQERVHVGSSHPGCLTVQPISSHESSGVLASFMNVSLEHGPFMRAELRRKDTQYALFVFHFDDIDLPEWWEDSEIVWSLEQQRKDDKSAQVS